MNNNGQSAALNFTNEQLQVYISGLLGDGCITSTKGNSTFFQTSCIHKEYLEYKKLLLNTDSKSIGFRENNGFTKTPIYYLRSRSNNDLLYLKNLSLKDKLEQLTDLGLALWIYDDGSLHKSKLFYNLNTQQFSKEDQENYIIPYLQKYNIYGILTKECKKDGRVFWYIRIPKFKGSYEISMILKRYPLSCFNYKIWSSETIQKWSKLQEKLKSTGKDVSSYTGYQLSCMMKKISL